MSYLINHFISFSTVDAYLHGVETRTSSPIQISRDSDSYECVNVARLYPTGEGAGYAGGIVRYSIITQDLLYFMMC